jgi:hypothetical protein
MFSPSLSNLLDDLLAERNDPLRQIEVHDGRLSS